MTAAPTFLPAPIPDLLQRLKDDPATILTHGHKEILLGRAPGRLDIMGAIADYTGSLACELPLDAAAAIAVQRRDDRRLILKNYSGDTAGRAPGDLIELSLDDFYGTAALLPDSTLQQLFAGPRQWAASIAGAYPILARHKKFTRRTHGANIACYSTVPTGGGAGYTSAVACATLAAIAAAYHLVLEPLETAILSQNIQHHIVGLPGGIADAAASVLGKKDQLVLFSGQPHRLHGYLPVPQGFLFAGIHTGPPGIAHADAIRNLRTSSSIAHAIIARMYKDMGFKKDPTGGCLAGFSTALYQRYFRQVLPESMDGKTYLDQWGPLMDRGSTLQAQTRYSPRAAADYHISENLRAVQFVEHLRSLANAADASAKNAAATAAGALMLESHRSAAQYAGLKSPTAELLVDLITQCGPAQGFFGARANGGALAIFAADSARQSLADICALFQQRTGICARLLAASSPGSADAPPINLPLSEL